MTLQKGQVADLEAALIQRCDELLREFTPDHDESAMDAFLKMMKAAEAVCETEAGKALQETCSVTSKSLRQIRVVKLLEVSASQLADDVSKSNVNLEAWQSFLSGWEVPDIELSQEDVPLLEGVPADMTQLLMLSLAKSEVDDSMWKRFHKAALESSEVSFRTSCMYSVFGFPKVLDS